MFKVGDRIELKEDGPFVAKKGYTGVIKAEGGNDYTIHFDEDICGWSDTSLGIPRGHGAFINKLNVTAPFRVGDAVCVIVPQSEEPFFKWGDYVKSGDIGIVGAITTDSLIINFPNREGWMALKGEVKKVTTVPVFDTKARELMIDSIEKYKRVYEAIFNNNIKLLKRANSPEGLMEAKKRLLVSLVDLLPLNPNQCYFCLSNKNKCAKCEYAQFHGVCTEENSTYTTIIKAKDKLCEALQEYYTGESYRRENR